MLEVSILQTHTVGVSILWSLIGVDSKYRIESAFVKPLSPIVRSLRASVSGHHVSDIVSAGTQVCKADFRKNDALFGTLFIHSPTKSLHRL